MTDTGIKNDATKPEGVVEKRVKPTVIRRRKVKAEEAASPAELLEAKAEVKVEAETKAKKEVSVAKEAHEEVKEKPKTEKKAVRKTVEEKRVPLKIIAQPEEVKQEEGKGEEGAEKVAHKTIREVTEVEKAARVAKKKKSRAELQFDDIQKFGGLKQYARNINNQEVAPATEQDRVFEPGLKHRKKKGPKKGFKKTQITEPKAIKKIIKVAEGITVASLSQSMGVKASDIIKKLMGLGMMASVNQIVDTEMATLIASEYGYEIENVAFKEEDFLKVTEKHEEKFEEKTRPPVVTVMGHVDHGKTSILDIIREANVAEGEAGGITQHIGAYTVNYQGKNITFVDTPGHEAFTHMRARGAKVTDIVILVVAADDGVMPQTKEAIDHARAAEVPIIVAINKIDKANAAPDKVKRELSEVGLQPEEWGGQTICVPTSAKTKEGIDSLLEMVLLQAEILELKARYEGRAEGIVIESKMDRRRGPVITGLVKKGTLKLGDCLVSGVAFGNVKAMLNDKGQPVEVAGPTEPVEILGLSDVPEAGEQFVVVEDDKIAKMVGDNRMQKQRECLLAKRSKITLEDLTSKMSEGETRELNLIIKTDVKGVADAVRDSLPGLSTKDVKINVLHAGVGGINESDIMLASASNAVVLGFNVVADTSARNMAEQEGIELKTYSVIYEMLDDVKKAVAGMLEPKEVEKVLGRAEVKDIFNVPKVGVVAGCIVKNGKIIRSAKVRLLRDNVIIHDGKIGSLKRFKDDVREVLQGLECGIGIENYRDIKPGDEIEAYIIEKIAMTWEESKG